MGTGRWGGGGGERPVLRAWVLGFLNYTMWNQLMYGGEQKTVWSWRVPLNGLEPAGGHWREKYGCCKDEKVKKMKK